MRIAIADDMNMAVEILRRVLAYVPEHELAWVAHTGAEAVEQCALDPPDLILMDLHMPVLDGVEATRRIMATSPCAILIVTASVIDHSAKVFEAMGLGALDAVDTPVVEAGGQAIDGELLLTKIATISKLIGKSERRTRRAPSRAKGRVKKKSAVPLLTIGSSTGGPMALAKILSQLPADFPAATVIIQHVDVQFSAGLATWLNDQTPLKVELALPNCQPRVGTVWVAGTNDHLVMKPDWTMAYEKVDDPTPYCPSVDIFFHSVAQHWPDQGTAVLLTGMGTDGAHGLKDLHQIGWRTIAQDESTSVVYGMPKAAVELAAVDDVLAIDAIGPALVAAYKDKD